ncbi:exosortase family protein XrtG [Wukongibacter baidiensis]|uniref:exosortase family protein XrtG n=1 Tax=Wukongibacter baidiensis TaxID=1723361 RepID=UPI003D7F627E
MEKLLLFILIVMVWGFAFLIFRNSKMYFFKFLAGSVGVFTISMIFFLPHFDKVLNTLITNALIMIEQVTGLFEVFKGNSIISIDTADGIVSMIINYECSGVIEMLVFTSLALFFPFGGITRKSVSIIAGNIYLYIANIIRIVFIVIMLKLFGASSYYIVHTLLARILFFAFSVLLYYFVFTSTQLKYQKVGEM